MLKKTLYGDSARAKIFEGIKKIAAAVKVTLGPSGRNVLISKSMIVDYGVHSLPINVTKDGHRTAQAFDLEDPHEKAGVLLVKEACRKTVDQAGDGTTTTAVLLEAIVEQGMKLIEAGANPMELKRGIDKAVRHVIDELKGMAIQIGDDNDKILQIASISANNDAEIGRLIADAFKVIGNEGIIDIEESKSVETEIKMSKGYRFERGWLAPIFVNKKEKLTCEFENPLILLYEKTIIHHTQMERALTVANGRPILIICEDAKEEGLGFLGLNVYQGRLQCCVVKSPSFGESRREDMEDLAILTGGTYISDSKGVGIKEMEFENFGQASKIIVTKEETTIIGGNSDKGALQNLLNELRMNLAQAKNEDEKAPIEKRIAKLIGGVAVIQVGAATETEMKERLDRFDDAIRATKSAISEGYVVGAGTSFLKIIPKGVAITATHITTNKQSVEDQCIRLIYNVLREPLKQICRNAGVDDEYIQKSVSLMGGNFGYNAKSGKVEDLIKAGVIDPVKVLRCALQNAASSATMVLTTEVLIADTM
jgi:chaperonin GroEL